MDDTRDEVGEILAGMTGGRTGTAGGVSSPVPPAADWPRGLDAASASAARLTMLLSDVYKAHQGKEPSASLAAQIEQTVRNLTGEPPQEPEYGPGLWTAMPQRSWETMGMARPIDWTGAPSRTEIDLMTMHAIRYVFLVKSVFRVSSLIFFGFRHEECRPVVCFTGCPSCRT